MAQSRFENHGNNLGMVFLGSCVVAGGSTGTRPVTQASGVFINGTCENTGGSYTINLGTTIDPAYAIPLCFAEVGSTFTASWGGQMSTSSILIYCSANVTFKIVLLGMPRVS